MRHQDSINVFRHKREPHRKWESRKNDNYCQTRIFLTNGLPTNKTKLSINNKKRRTKSIGNKNNKRNVSIYFPREITCDVDHHHTPTQRTTYSTSSTVHCIHRMNSICAHIASRACKKRSKKESHRKSLKWMCQGEQHNIITHLSRKKFTAIPKNSSRSATKQKQRLHPKKNQRKPKLPQ